MSHGSLVSGVFTYQTSSQKKFLWRDPLSRFLTRVHKIKKIAMKSLAKISHSEWTLTCRSRHSCIKLTLMWCEKLGRNPNWRVVIMYVRMYVSCVYACQSHHSPVGSVLDVKPGFVSQVRHQNEIWKKNISSTISSYQISDKNSKSK